MTNNCVRADCWLVAGTEMYDPERGGIVDVSILDVVQIFGRAGRPQYDNTGHAILITAQKSLNNYLSLLSLQVRSLLLFAFIVFSGCL